MGTTTVDATHPYGTPQSPYMMKAFHGTVVNFGNQVDGQPAVGNLRADGTGGYNAKAVPGAYIVAIMNPAPLVTDGSGHLNLAPGVNLTGCSTTVGSTTVNCASTTGLSVGMAIVGYGVSNNATVTQVSSATQFVMSAPAIIATMGKNFAAVSLAGATADQYLMRVNMGGVDYDECWTINRKVNPRSLTMTWRAQALIGGVLSGPVLTTTQTYTPTAGSASGNRLTAYPMGAWSEAALPDTSQVVNTTATFGEDGDYTTLNQQSFTDNGDGTITDNVTGLMWQKTDAGEMTWENAVNSAASVTTGGYSDWRLPNPHELFSLFNYENGNPALNTSFFPTGAPAAEYWWTRDVFGTSTTNVWCVNSGGGLGPKPKAETISAGGAFRYHARYVRLAQNNMTHNYVNNGDGTVTDTDTSLMWIQLPGSSMNWESALSYAENLTTGGYSDWRLPNIKELQTLTDYSLATVSGGSATNNKPCINRTIFAKTMAGCATTGGSPIVSTSDTTDLVVGMTVIDPYSVAGSYINHTTTPTITAINPGVSFTLSSNAVATGSGLTFRALPVATAYWSSTSLKNTPTEAWLLELGVNSSVPPAEGPPRGSQGIISYQAKTASFPVFAVRTAVLTSQIAVSQGATSLTDGVSTVSYGNVNVGSNSSKTFTITNTGSTPLSITAVTIDGTNSSNFSVTSAPASPIAASGTTSFTVLFNALFAGSKVAALHIATSDAGNPTFDINLSGTGFVPPPTISNITVNPISPTSTDAVTVTAQVTPGNGGTISGVNLTYDLGAQVTTDVFKETFAMAASNNWNGTNPAALNAWTTVGAGNTRQAVAQSNRTALTTLTGATTTSGSPNVTCGSTAGLWPGMLVSGPNMPVNGATATRIASVTNATQFVLTANATTSGTTTLIVNGASLTGCITTTGSTTVTCDSTGGLFNGMALTGTGLANNATVSSVTNATTFVMSATPTTPTSGFTITASGAALEFNGGTVAASATTTNAINTLGTSGYVEFYMQARDLFATNNNGWTFDVSSDGGATWNTRLAEDWNSNTVNLANCVLNSTGANAGSTTVTCTSTAGLTVGRSLYGPTIYSAVTCGTTTGSNVVTCPNTAGLQVNMFVTGTGIPNGSRIGAITANTSFTLVNGNSPGTAVNATATGSTAVAATYLSPTATVASVNANGTTFTINTAAYFNTTAAPVAVAATTLNHGYTTKADGTSQPYRYNLAGAELGANTKIRWQFTGYSATQPTRAPRCNVDDIVINTTTGVPPVVVTMYDDGTNGDAVAGDGSYTGSIPAQADGSTVNFTISATGSGGSGTSTSSTTSYAVAPSPTITTASPLPAGNTVAPYNQTLTATGGSGTGYTWSIFSGALPGGLTLSSGGVISGTATAAGTFNFTAQVTDSANRSATKAFALTVSAVTPPNVVVIITDDQGWGDVGYHTPAGQVPIQTPVMDSFGTTRPGSIRLERFYATTVCSVTRSTMLTGRNPIRHATNNTRGTDLSEHLMPQTFKAAGYQTFMCGKWHMGGSDKNLHYTTLNGVNTRIIQEGLQYAPYNRGFDSHYGQYSGAIDYFTHWSAEAENPDRPDWWLNGVQQDGPSEHTDSQGTDGWSPNLLADKAIAHIQNRDPNKPMYLHLAFNSIHGPVSAPANLITKYQNLGVTNANRRLIAAAVDGTDQAMGRVLAALDAAGITNNTIVLWFGDNGGDETKGSLNDPLRGDKGDSYDGGLREVAGISYPGVLPTGVISHQYMWVGDVFPTLCAATGVTPQNTKPFDGVNVWPNLLAANNSTTTTLRPGSATLVTDTAAPIAINKFTDPVNGGTKDFKLIRGRVNNVVTPELFNLTDDPQETTDLIANPAYSSIVTSLTNAVTAISAENFKPYIGPPLITNSVGQGGTITLYVPFTSYPNGTLTAQWRKNGVNIPGATSYTQVTDASAALVRGAYTTTYTLTNVSPADAATYDVVVTNSAGNITSEPGVLTVTFGTPALNPLPAYTKGTSQTVTWSAVLGATSYTIQRAATSDFATILSSQTVSTPTATFTGLTSGAIYFYRATATDGVSTSTFSNTVSSTQDAGNPLVTITAPTNGATVTTSTINVQGTATDAISGIAAVTVNGVAATTADNYAHWSATVPLVSGANTITATGSDNASAGGNIGTASITVTLNAVNPVISDVTITPTLPTFIDPVTVTARVQAGAAPVSLVRVSYDTGTPVSTAIWREVFNNTSSNNWNGTGAINPWTTVGAGNVRQAVAQSNHTVPVSITSAATTGGSTTVTCASTANLWPGMLITGPNIPGSINGTSAGNTTIASITNGTSFVLSQAASGTGTGQSLTAAGVTLTNVTTTAASTAVTCDRTNGLINGMSLSGTGLANNATVASVASGTAFTMTAAPTTPGSALTLSTTGAAAEFNGGTANLTDSMFSTTNAINTSGTAGYVEFWVQTRDLAANNSCGWAFQVSSDNGATWNTRLSEDWNSETVNLTNVVTNSAGAAAGSTTVTCADTTGLTTGRTVSGPNVYVTCGLTSGQSTVTCANTAGLLPGMALQGTGIPNNTRIGSIVANTSFTLVTGTGATPVNATATNASAAVAATYFPAATVSSITNATTFVLSTPAYVNTTAAPIAATATTLNHGYQLFHYDLVGAELGTQTKFRFQGAGYTPTAPTRSPRISIDDILVATTVPQSPVFVTMFDDGLHGDGAAGDGVFGAQIPPLAGGTNVNFSITATASNAGSTIAVGYSYAVNSALTDATIRNAEFLGMPTENSVTLNVVANVDQYAFVEYGTTPGAYTASTPITLFSVDPAKPEFYNPIEITITGLQPDTEYYYRFRHRDTNAAYFNARGERSFHTARVRGSSFVFTVTADPHLDVNSDLPLFLRTMSNIAADGPDIHVDLGDIFMTDKLADGVAGVPPEFFGGVTLSQSNLNNRVLFFRQQFERVCHSVPFFYTQGNHEAEYGYLFNAAADKQNNVPAWNLKSRKALYPTPVPSPFYTGNPTPKDYVGGTLGLLENYYACEWGDALFIVLDPFWNTTTSPNQADDAWHWTLGKPQYDWLKATLQNSSARYKFVFMHHIVGGSTTLADGITKNVAGRGGVEVADKYEWGGKNVDGTEGFATRRPGWDMPIHQLLVQNKVNIVFHGHDHLYAYQTLDGVTYLECPQPGTPNFTSLGSAGDGKYTTGVLLPNSGHIRVTVTPSQALAEYVRAFRPQDENATRHNQDIAHSFAMAPRIFAPVEMLGKVGSTATFRWNAVPNKPYTVQWSPNLVNWTNIDSVTFPAVNTNGIYTDTNASRVNQPRVFYRVSYNP